jgi:DNA-binding NarL/FixJ family response regulator
MHASSAYLEAVFEAGGTGYVLKSGICEELLEAAGSVVNGRIYVSPCLPTVDLERFQNGLTDAGATRLSLLESKTLQLIAEGNAAAEIARIMNISVKTVASHRRNIEQKLGLSSTGELMSYWKDQGQPR